MPFHRRAQGLILLFALGASLVLGVRAHSSAEPVAGSATERLHATVLIVGAGLTGLTTAYELHKAGIDAQILEASPRIGGRVQTVRLLDGDTAEAHMEEYFERNPAYGLLRELKLELADDVAHSSVRLGGKLYPYQGDGDRHAYLSGIFSAEEERAWMDWNTRVWALYQKLHESHYGGHPLPPELAALMKISFAEFVARDRLPEKVSEWIRVTVEPEMAIEWDQISALDGIDEVRLFLDTPEGFGEKNYHVKGGNTRFVQALAAAIGPRAPLVNAQVTAIAQRADGVTVRYLQDGYTYREATADYVVVTVPVYSLRWIQFSPQLSAEKQRAIETTRFGSYIKVHLGVAPAATRLWERDGESILTLLSDTAAGSVYDATSLQGAPEDRDTILTLLVHARFAKPLLGLSHDAMRERSIDNLEALFPGVRPHVKWAEIFVYPTAVAYWPLALGRSRFDELASRLREPEGRLYVGGDTTEDSHSEGAVQAGLRMAKGIVARERAVGAK